LGKGYFGKFDEEAVKNNFVLVYELLDGIFGPLSFSFSADMSVSWWSPQLLTLGLSYYRNPRLWISPKHRD
jgi:hypothetical protein